MDNQDNEEVESKSEPTLLGLMYTKLKYMWDCIIKRRYYIYSAMAIMAFKKAVYDRFLPISEVIQMAKQDMISKVLMSNYLIVSFFRSPSLGQWSYCLSSLDPVKPREVWDQFHEKIQVGSIWPRERGIYDLVKASASIGISYITMNSLLSQVQEKKYNKKDEARQTGKSFEDVGGCRQAKDAIKRIISFVKHPDKFKSMGVRMPKGVLLYGPPGTGKTLIAKAAASEANVPMIYCAGSEFVELYVGNGPKKVRELFKQAREVDGAAMIFIDEIDAVGAKRVAGGGLGGGREFENTLNQLLNEMDGFEENNQVIVVAATNLVKQIDPALCRPGRFDQRIEVKAPNPNERVHILRIHLRDKKHSITGKELLTASQALEGCTGADIESIINLTALKIVNKALDTKEPVCIHYADLSEEIQTFLEDRRSRNGNQQQNNYSGYNWPQF